jgi:hypothetical protein
MVKPARIVAFGASALLLISSAAAKDLADYKLGDRVEEDISTPTALVVIDADATAALKEKEGERVPVIFRFFPNATDETMTAFHEAFTKTRGNFLDAVEHAFDKRKLDSNALALDKFNRVVSSFQKKNPYFPVNTELGRMWAGGESDQEFETRLLNSLRDAMKHFIRATNTVPEGAKVGGTVRVVSYSDNETLTEQIVAKRGKNYPKSEFISFQRAKTDFVDSFPDEEHAIAKYLSAFLKPNCAVEEELTIVMRAKRSEGISATDNFSAGQIIARRGQLVDAKTLAAIGALKEKMAVIQAAHPPVVAQGAATSLPVSVAHKNYWLIGSVAGGVLILFAGVAIFVRRKSSASMLPARIESGVMAEPGSAEEKMWQQRALAAERRAEKAQAVIRKGLIGHLAGWMSDALVQKLLLQRAHLIDAQQKAVTEVDKLGQRLEKVHSRMHERLVAYERRISELEKELDTKDEINRELIHAEIRSIRRQMDAERAKSEMN